MVDIHVDVLALKESTPSSYCDDVHVPYGMSMLTGT